MPRVVVAEFSLVLVLVVEPLHSVVGAAAPVFLRAALGLCEFAKFRRVEAVVTAPVLQRVVVVAGLVVVRRSPLRALELLEPAQHQVPDGDWIAGEVVYVLSLSEFH